MNLTKLLADWCADYTLRFPASAIHTAELAIADTVCCVFAAADDFSVVRVGSTITDEKSGPSRKSNSLQHAFPVSARDAAAVNGCAAHALTAEERYIKFIDCVTPCPGKVRTKEIYSKLLEFFSLSAIGEVTRAFAQNQGNSYLSANRDSELRLFSRSCLGMRD